MDEEGWLGCEDPKALADHLGPAASPRKLRLYHCACCRRVWEHIGERSRQAVEVAERFSDGLAAEAELFAAHEQAEAAFTDLRRVADWLMLVPGFSKSATGRFFAAQSAICATGTDLGVWGVSWAAEKTKEAR